MNLHKNKELFSQAVEMTSQHFRIKREFVEKDYWICRSLQLLAAADKDCHAVFKGGTSLTKAYGIGSRFSEDIDIAIANSEQMTGNQLKTIIKKTAHIMSWELEEIPKVGLTSKGSHYYKAFFAYPTISDIPNASNAFKHGEILLEINSFANPYPCETRQINSFVTDFLNAKNRQDIIVDYEMQSFNMTVFDRRRTMTEKLVSLVRCSMGDDYIVDLNAHIRHFYDLYYLSNDEKCVKYMQGIDFNKDFEDLLTHDMVTFQRPVGWQKRDIAESPLLKDFRGVWQRLQSTYLRELPELSYKEIPSADDIFQAMVRIIGIITSHHK